MVPFCNNACMTDIQLEWRKANKSGPWTDNCVEVADLPDGGKAIRDSKLGADSPVLSFNLEEWDAFVDGVKKGEFDLTPAGA